MLFYVKNKGFKHTFRFHVENKMAASFDTSSSDEDIGKTHEETETSLLSRVLAETLNIYIVKSEATSL